LSISLDGSFEQLDVLPWQAVSQWDAKNFYFVYIFVLLSEDYNHSLMCGCMSIQL
jgi:hypothetical protein